MYLFTWELPALGGKFKSTHGMDQFFVFDNIDEAPGLWGPTPDPRRFELADKISKAFVTFARSGSPGHPGLPKWNPYTVSDRATMVLNFSWKLVSDPRRDERLAIERLRSRI
jgi:para-nitrobenzyl esterase